MYLLDITATPCYMSAMNRSHDDSIATAVKTRIRRRPHKSFWSYSDFSDLHTSAVAAALSRLAKHGELRRIRRGIYHRPHSTAFGISRPDPASVAEAIFKNRRSIPVRGFHRLGLTTQMSNELKRAVDRPMRVKPIKGIKVRTVTRPISRQKGIHPDERAALDALRNIRRLPDITVTDTLRRIASLIKNGTLEPRRLTRFTSVEPPRVRALVGALLERIGHRDEGVEALRKSLNPLTKFKVHASHDILPTAAAWHLV
jgi:Family of unknown function (DUF6088)